MPKSKKENSKIINIEKATKSKNAKKETKRVVDAIIDYRMKNGVKDAKGGKIFLEIDSKRSKSDRLAWLENQKEAYLTSPRINMVVAPLEDMVAKLDADNLTIEELMLAKHNLRNDRIKELNKQIY